MNRKEISQKIIALCAKNAIKNMPSVCENTINIRVQKQGDKINCDVSLKVYLNTIIPKIAWELQEKIKEKIEALTDTPVASVDIEIVGVVENE